MLQYYLPLDCDNEFAGDKELEQATRGNLTVNNILYIFPTLNFTCNGNITDVRMAMDKSSERPSVRSIQEVFLVIAIFRGSTVSDVILLKNDNVTYISNGIWRNKHKLTTSVQSGDYIGIAIPRDNFTGNSVYYQWLTFIDEGRENDIGRQAFSLGNYSNVSGLEQFVRDIDTDGPRMYQNSMRPLIQFTVGELIYTNIIQCMYTSSLLCISIQ